MCEGPCITRLDSCELFLKSFLEFKDGLNTSRTLGNLGFYNIASYYAALY